MSTFLSRDKMQQLAARAREERILRETNLRKALQLLRDALDSPHLTAGSAIPDLDRLFQAEELLSRELGNPVWSYPRREVCS